MSSYYDDDQPYAPQGRARVPGGGHGDPDGYEPPPGAESFDPFAPQYGAPAYEDPYVPPAPPTPSGRATVGRASVRPPTGGDDYVPPPGGMNDGYDPFASAYGDPGYGDVPGTGYGDPAYGDPGYPQPGQPVGRASVRPTPTAGRAPVGRATVGGPPGPGGPVNPGGPRPGGPGGPTGGGRGKKPVNKKSRRRNRILAAFASLIMLSGLLVVVITYYAESIPTPANLPLPQATTITYSNGNKMAQIGKETRYTVPLAKVPVPIRNAIIATEDKTFYTNIGVDVKGIARAFVNNVEGKDTQGASTITQQYARYVAGLTYSQSYTRKAREIIIAIKLTQHYSKDQILEDYLNSVLFGRLAYGIQAAALAYFGTNVENLSLSQGMVLAGLIKDPDSGQYDPTCKCQSALDRWGYTRGQMVADGMITKTQAAALKYPTDALPSTTADQSANQDINTPVGFIVHHVMDELSRMTTSDGSALFPLKGPNSLLLGGYTIKTTIDQNAEKAAIAAAGGGSGSPVARVYTIDKKKKTKEDAAALVAVQPGTGRVLAYYGGPNGADLDFAGVFQDPVMAKGDWSGANIIPGSTFKTITMATALSQNISMHSWWWGPTSLPVQGRAPVSNTPYDDCPGQGNVCQMWQALQHSTNTVFYQIGQKVGIGNLINMAYNLGINHIWSDSRCAVNGVGKRIDLTAGSGGTHTDCLSGEIAFGEFGVAVQDVANVMATLANHGVKETEHFVEGVTQGFQKTPIVRERIINAPVPGMNAPMVDDETWAMEQVYNLNGDEKDNQLSGGRQAAVKTGTWQLGANQESALTQGAMYNGFTAGDSTNGGIAASVWIGSSGNPLPVYYTYSDGSNHNLGGSNAPADVWQRFVDAYEKGKPYEKFAPPVGTGNPAAGGTPSPIFSSPPPTPGNCAPLPACPTQPSGSPGGQPSDQPSPQALSASVTNKQNTNVTITWDNSGGGGPLDRGPVTINWGDGSSQPGNSQGQKTHHYGNNNTYTITVTDADDPSRSQTFPVTVP